MRARRAARDNAPYHTRGMPLPLRPAATVAGVDERRQSHPLPSSWPPGRCSLSAWAVVTLLRGLTVRREHRPACGTGPSIIAGGTPSARRGPVRPVLSAILGVAALPFGFYRGFLLERRYGLSTETIGGWLTGHVKAGLIGLAARRACGATCLYLALGAGPGSGGSWSAIGYGLVLCIAGHLGPVAAAAAFYRSSRWRRRALRDRLDRARATGGHARRRRVRVDARAIARRRRTPRWPDSGDTGDPGVGYAAGRVLGRRNRGHPRARAGASRAPGYLDAVAASTAVLAFAGLWLARLRARRRRCPCLDCAQAADLAGIPVLVARCRVGLCRAPVANALSRAHERRADAYALRPDEQPARSSPRCGGWQQNLAEESPSRLVEVLFYTPPAHQGALARTRADMRWVRRCACRASCRLYRTADCSRRRAAELGRAAVRAAASDRSASHDQLAGIRTR